MTQPSRPFRSPHTGTESDEVYVRDALQYEDLPPRLAAPKRRRRGLAVLAVATAVIVVLALAAWWVDRQARGNPHGGAVAVTIPQGASTSSIGSLLHQKGVIGNTLVWRLYTIVKRPGPLQSGDYRFSQHDESMGHVLSVLQGGGQAAVRRLTIPEGLTLQEIADRVGNIPGLSASRFLAVADSGIIHSEFQPPGSTSLEGLLYADTYFIEPGEDETGLVAKMVDNFDHQATAIGMQNAPAKAGVSPYEAITVASLVEKEAKVDEDRGMIARTIYNRLQKNMKLGIDATIDYALGTHKPQLTAADLDIDSPYNTRKYPGLPPTPIAAVGQKSLDAALNPTPGPWLYYVLIDPSGKHAFATTDAEFEQLVRQARAKGLI